MAFEKYSKIETLFNRDEKFKVMIGSFRDPLFELVRYWSVTEKVDGMNIRVSIDENDQVRIGGKTDRAQLPKNLEEHLRSTFTPALMKKIRLTDEPVPYTLYGEGYGAGIQKGGGYSKDQRFVLFDVKAGERAYLSETGVTDVAERLGILRVPIISSRTTIKETVVFVESGFYSHMPGADPDLKAEGVVARSPFYDSRGKRVMFKLKHRDFARIWG